MDLKNKIKLSGKKMKEKTYTSHSGYPGGLRVRSFEEVMTKKPEYVIEHAVKGMLPRTKLGRQMIKKLKIFAEGEKNQVNSLSK